MGISNYLAGGWVHAANCNGIIKIPQDIKERLEILNDWCYLPAFVDLQGNSQAIYSALLQILLEITTEYRGNINEIFRLNKSGKFTLPSYDSICIDNLQNNVDILIREFYTYWIHCMVRYRTNQMKYKKIKGSPCPHITLTIRNGKYVVSKHICYFHSFNCWVYWFEGLPTTKISDPGKITIAPNYVVTLDDIKSYLHMRFPDAIITNMLIK